MTTFCAFDGSKYLPPFLPLERGADGLFGELLRSTCLSLIGHLPLCVTHDPLPVGGRAPMLSQLGARATPAHLVDLVLREWWRPSTTDVRERTRSLRDFLDDVTRDREAFAQAFAGWRLRYLERTLEATHSTGTFPRRWCEDVETARACALQATRTVEADAAPAATYVSALRRLLTIWPDVDAAARRLRAAGIRPGVEEPPC
jgi:hypothetical protein